MAKTWGGLQDISASVKKPQHVSIVQHAREVLTAAAEHADTSFPSERSTLTSHILARYIVHLSIVSQNFKEYWHVSPRIYLGY